MLNSLSEVTRIQKPIEQVAACVKCACTWFEQVLVNQYKADHYVVIGQGPPLASNQEFKLLRCIKCSELYAPTTIINAQDSSTKLWNLLLDQLDEKK